MRLVEIENRKTIDPNISIFTFSEVDIANTWRPIQKSDGFRYFGTDRNLLNENQPPRALRVCVATSVRDIGCDDRANRVVKIGGNDIYMQGSLHALLDATKERLKGIVEVVGIVVDDVQESGELNRNGEKYSSLPRREEDSWILPADYELPNGKSLQEVVHNIPSYYRKLPATAHRELIHREREKLNFERSLERYASEVGADVILSDHLMIRLEHLFREGVYARRVVNIHPAVTWEHDENRLRGRSPTADAIERAQKNGYHKTGASFHFISSELDAGPVICDGERTEVYPDDLPQELRYRNYQCSKIPVMIEGLKYLAQNLDELLDKRPDGMSSPLGERS